MTVTEHVLNCFYFTTDLAGRGISSFCVALIRANPETAVNYSVSSFSERVHEKGVVNSIKDLFDFFFLTVNGAVFTKGVCKHAIVAESAWYFPVALDSTFTRFSYREVIKASGRVVL